jgi:uncharacterized protein (DUF488 family)
MVDKAFYTIGHSTRPIDEFIALLNQHHISQLVDVRTIAKSRHNPQYGSDELAESLHKAGISYFYEPKLGGLRSATKPSTNQAWRNASFRNYADYMQTAEFVEGLHNLLKLVAKAPTAIMCAEAVPWRCHRSLIADATTARGYKVCEIISKSSVQEHKITSFAKVSGTTVTYPKNQIAAGEVSNE